MVNKRSPFNNAVVDLGWISRFLMDIECFHTVNTYNYY